MRGKASRLLGSFTFPRLKNRTHNSWAAVQDTFNSTKEIFEKHRVVFTVGTSIASVATAWGGYTLRHLHESKVEQRLQSIENAIQENIQLEHSELKRLVDPGSYRATSWFATIGTTFLLGYGFGWRGGRWYTNRKIRREQMRLSGQMKPSGWPSLGKMKLKGLQLQSLRRRFTRSKTPESAMKLSGKKALKSIVGNSEKMLKDVPATPNPGVLQQS